MSKEFDAYYKWLGIPPKDQPPNHYRLLGIELFEENPEVIEASAERQASYLHEVSAGPNVKESQKLLNEIAAARLCLLDAEKKAAYDAKLESKVAANVTVSDLASGGSPLDDLPWDNLEDLMNGETASETMAKGSDSSDTLPLPAPKSPGVPRPNSSGVLSTTSSGVFTVPKSLAPKEPGEPEPQAPTTKIPVRWLVIGGGGGGLLIIAFIIFLFTKDSGPDVSPGQPPKPSSVGERSKPNGPPQQDANTKNGNPRQHQRPDKPEIANEREGGPHGNGAQIVKQPQQQPGSKEPFNKVSDNKEPDKGPATPTAIAKSTDSPKENMVEKVETVPDETPVVPQGPIKTNGFEPIRPEVRSITGTSFEVSDFNVFADGRSRGDVFTVEASTRIPNITAIRLEALPHSDIPSQGPGRGRNGRFDLTEVSVDAAPLDGKTQGSKAAISGVVSEDAPVALDNLLDGNQSSFWPVDRPGQATTLTIHMEHPLGNDSGTRLRFVFGQRSTLAHFRVSVSNDPALLGVRTPCHATLPLFVNVGGKAEDRDGVKWLASPPFHDGSFGHVGGQALESSSGIAPFYSCVLGIEAFRVRVPEGKYNVVLLFCGRWPENVEACSFSVAVEGGKSENISAIPNASKGRPHNAASLSVQVEVRDGILDIEFTKGKGDTVLNGVVVQKAT